MPREIPISQARAEFADLLNRVAYAGERVTLTRHGRPVAALVPASDLTRLEQLDEELAGYGEVAPRMRPLGAPSDHPSRPQRHEIAAELSQPEPADWPGGKPSRR